MQTTSDPKPQLPPPGYPTSYHGLHWDSINRVKDYLYRQLLPLLEDASSRLGVVERTDLMPGRAVLGPVAHRLAMARNTLAAWAALITVESGGLVPDAKRLPLVASALPTWLVEHINSHTTLTTDYTRPIFVHPEVFFESLLLLAETGEEVGALLQISLADAVETPRGVWLRAVFVPPARGDYSGMSTLLNALIARQDAGDAAFRLQVTGSLMKINGSRLVLQNNRKTGEQALAALLPTLTTEDLRGQRSEAWHAPWRTNERQTHDAAAHANDLPQPFRLDDDSDRPTEETIVPAFPPGALESWLESADSDLDADPFTNPGATDSASSDGFPSLSPDS